MEKRALTFIAALVLAGISLGVSACTQAAPVAAAPADTTAPAAAPAPPEVVVERPRVVVEENHPRPAAEIKVEKRDDGDRKSVDVQVRP